MKKIHTRTKRKRCVTSTSGHQAFFKNKPRKVGAKSFGTLEKAKAWMKLEKMSDKEYQVLPAKKGKRFAVKQIF